MAVIWQKSLNNKHYEVRTAGQTRRLYTDGVFHSQYNPGKTLTGNVWDLLSLPAFFVEPELIRRVLVLGVGGGAVIHQLQNWFPAARIIGIELDKTHLYIARKFFNLSGGQVELVEADALEWVRQYRGLPFDLVIDDLFAEQEGEPIRVVEATQTWMNNLSRLMTDHAALVMNFISAKQLRACSVIKDKKIKKPFSMAYRLMTPLYENQVGVFLRHAATTNQWRRRIMQLGQLAREYDKYRDKYQLRKVAG